MRDAQNIKRKFPERFRRLFHKNRMDEIVRHLPNIAEILIEGAALNLPGATKGFIRLIRDYRENGLEKDRGETGALLSDGLTSVLAAQRQLNDRCRMLEDDNARMKREVARGAKQVILLTSEMQIANAAIKSLRARNTYYGWAILTTGLLALAELIWIAAR